MYNENGNSISEQVENKRMTIYYIDIYLFKVLGSFVCDHNEISVE